MIAGIWISALVAAAVLAWVAIPLLRAPERSTAAGADTLGDARDLQSRQQMLLASLKDLEDDRATEKVGEEDYAELRARLSAEAIEVMRAIEADEERRAAELASRTVRHPGSRRPGHSR